MIICEVEIRKSNGIMVAKKSAKHFGCKLLNIRRHPLGLKSLTLVLRVVTRPTPSAFKVTKLKTNNNNNRIARSTPIISKIL